MLEPDLGSSLNTMAHHPTSLLYKGCSYLSREVTQLKTPGPYVLQGGSDCSLFNRLLAFEKPQLKTFGLTVILNTV